MDGDLVGRVRAALRGVRNVEERRMFGGVTFMVDGKMCVGASPRRIMCRIDPKLHQQALRTAGCSTVVMRGREYRGYVHVAAESLTNRGALEHWLALALAHNRQAREARKRGTP